MVWSCRSSATLALALVATAPEAVRAQSGAVALPLEFSDAGNPLIPLHVNGKGPFWFIFDTGASSSTILPPLLLHVPLARAAQADRTVTTAGGRGSDTEFFRIDSLRYGPLSAQNVDAPLFKQPTSKSHELSGVAGVDIVRAHAVEFDLPASMMRRHAPAFTGGAGWTQIRSRYDEKSGAFFVELRVDSIVGEGLIDTGAQHTVLGPSFTRALGWTDSTSGVRRVGSVSGSEGNAIPIHMVAGKQFWFGPQALPAGPALFADLQIFQSVSSIGLPVAIIGMDILRRQRFLIDYPSRSVWLYTG